MSIILRVKNKLRSLLTIQFEPPPYEDKRAVLLDYAKEYSIDILVETGTFLGDTVDFFKNKFLSIYSIELAEDLAIKAQQRFKNDDHIHIIYGNSGDLLPGIVKELNRPALFWLDGHYSSEFQLGDEYIITAKGEKNTPVMAELEAVLVENLNHVILIDDARLFNGMDDYPKISQIKELLKKHKKNYVVKVELDIIRIFPN